MNFLIITRNETFSYLISCYLRNFYHHVEQTSSISDIAISLFETSFQAVIIDKQYITLSSYDLFIFAYSKKLKPLLLFINTENFTPFMIQKYKTENTLFLKLQAQNKKSDEAYTLFQNYLNNYLESFTNLLHEPLRQKETELISVIFKNKKPTNIVTLAELLWDNLNTKNIIQHKKTLYSYISRINSFCHNNNNITIHLSYLKGNYFFEPIQKI